MMILHKAFLIALLTLGIVSPGASAETDGLARLSKTITARLNLIYRAIAADPPGEEKSVVIEQEDGLVIIDAAESPPAERRLAETVWRISPKPVKFLIHMRDTGKHDQADRAFLKAWPSVTIVNTVPTSPSPIGAAVRDIEGYIKTYTNQIAATAKRLTHLGLSPNIHDHLRQIVDAGGSGTTTGT